MIDRYDDNNVLAQAKISREVALNLKIKEQYRNITAGSYNLGLGADYDLKMKTNINAEIFNFGKNAKHILVQASGNAGRAYVNETIFSQAKYTYDFDKKIGIEHPYNHVPSPYYAFSRELMDNAWSNFSTLRSVTRPIKDIELRSNITFGYRNDTQWSSRSRDYLFSDIQTYRQQTSIDYRQQKYDIALVTLYKPPSGKVDFRAAINYRAAVDRGDEHIRFFRDTVTYLQSMQRVGLSAIDIKAQLTSLLKDGNILYTSLVYHNNNPTSKIGIENGDQQRYYNLSKSYRQFYQENDINYQKAKLTSSYVRVRKYNTINAGLTINYERATIRDTTMLHATTLPHKMYVQDGRQRFANPGMFFKINYSGFKKLDLRFNSSVQMINPLDISMSPTLGYTFSMGSDRKLNYGLSNFTTSISYWKVRPDIHKLQRIKDIWQSNLINSTYGRYAILRGLTLSTAYNWGNLYGTKSWRFSLRHTTYFNTLKERTQFQSGYITLTNQEIAKPDHKTSLYIRNTSNVKIGSLTSSVSIARNYLHVGLENKRIKSLYYPIDLSLQYKARLNRYVYVSNRIAADMVFGKTLPYKQLPTYVQMTNATELNCIINSWRFSAQWQYIRNVSQSDINTGNTVHLSIEKKFIYRKRDGSFELSLYNMLNNSFISNQYVSDQFIIRDKVESSPLFFLLRQAILCKTACYV